MARPDRFNLALHEAAHAVASVEFEDDAEVLWATIDADEDSYGHVKYIAGRPISAGSLISTLLGPMAEGTPSWQWPPPTLDDAERAGREDFGHRIRGIITERGYDQLVQLVRDIWADPKFRLKVYLVAMALDRDGLLTGDEIRAVIA